MNSWLQSFDGQGRARAAAGEEVCQASAEGPDAGLFFAVQFQCSRIEILRRLIMPDVLQSHLFRVCSLSLAYRSCGASNQKRKPVNQRASQYPGVPNVLYYDTVVLYSEQYSLDPRLCQLENLRTGNLALLVLSCGQDRRSRTALPGRNATLDRRLAGPILCLYTSATWLKQ